MTYRCPNPKCDGGLKDLMFREPMVNSQTIDPKTGEIRDEYEPSEEEARGFDCRKCGAIVIEDTLRYDQDQFEELFDEWFTHSQQLQAAYKERKEKEREARREKARRRQKGEMEALRKQYEQESGFLPPMPSKRGTCR
jgi:hypothetical protein